MAIDNVFLMKFTYAAIAATSNKLSAAFQGPDAMAVLSDKQAKKDMDNWFNTNDDLLRQIRYTFDQDPWVEECDWSVARVFVNLLAIYPEVSAATKTKLGLPATLGATPRSRRKPESKASTPVKKKKK